MGVISKKYDFIALFDVTDGNPNGDPDNGNMPRMDIETGIGKVSAVCLKRKIRNYVALVKEGQPGYAMYISSGRSLNRADVDALIAQGVLPPDTKLKKLESSLAKLKDEDPSSAGQLVREAACATYFDVRTFGGVMTGYQTVSSDRICGPVQINIASSIDPIFPQLMRVTRCVYTTEKDQQEKGGPGTMGENWIVPYGLYQVTGHIDPSEAEKSSRLTGAGFSEDDLNLFWEAVLNMFEHDHSSSRGEMVLRKLIVFEHSSKLGSAHADELFSSVSVERKDKSKSPRKFTDYDVTIDYSKIPDAVKCIEMR